MGFLNKLFDQNRGGSARPAAPSAPQTGGGDVAWRRLQDVDRMACPVQMIEEDAATGEVAEIFEQIKATLQIPSVPNIDRILANAPQALKGTVQLFDSLYLSSNLPQPVVSMMLYAIALARNCQYCGSFHRLTCRTIGVDEAMLEAVGNNRELVEPERARVIVDFGLKAAMASTELTPHDFERLHALGIGDEEIVEIVGVAAMGVYLSIVADALKVTIDPMIKQGLAA